MTGHAGVVAEPRRAEDGVGAAVAEAHGDGAAVVLVQRADVLERIGHVGFAGLDLFQARLAARPGAAVLVPERSRHRAPEQVGRGRDVAMHGELVGDGAHILVDADDGAGEHDGGGGGFAPPKPADAR